MNFYTDLDNRKNMVRYYLRNNPKATFKEIKEKIHTKINKVYAGGLDEAYEDAGVPKPRTLKFKTKDERRNIIINFIKNNPLTGGQKIRKETKINFLALFSNTRAAFAAANVPYPREDHLNFIKRNSDQKRNKIITLLKENPLMSIDEIGKLSNTHPYSLFKNINEIYKMADLPFFSSGYKRRIKKQNIVIEFIKNNKLATQREINKKCKTKVQELFKRGIFEAYEKAEVEFPYFRINIHGSAIKKIRDEALLFEEDIARKLSCYGSVNRLIRTKRGVADIIMERKGKKVAIELKNYKSHEISISQIKQVNKYLEDIDSKLGFLICIKKPKKDIFLMEGNKIFVIEESEISKIPSIIDKDPW